MADQVPTLTIDPKVLQQLGLTGELVAVFEIKQLLNTFVERFQVYYTRLSDEEKNKLTAEQRVVLERTRPSELWFDDLRPTTEISINDRQKAAFFITFFDEVIEKLAGKAAVAVEEAQEAEEETGGGEQQEPAQPTKILTLDEIKQQFEELFPDIAELIAQQVITANAQAQSFSDAQRQQLVAAIQQLVNQHLNQAPFSLSSRLDTLLSPQNNALPAEAYSQEAQSYTLSPELTEFVTGTIATAFAETYAAEIEAAIVTIAAAPIAQPEEQAAAQPPAATPPTGPTAEPQFFTPTSVVPQLGNFTPEEVQRLTSVFPSGTEFSKIIRLRQTVYIQFFGPELAFNEQFLGDTNGYLLSQIIQAIRQHPSSSPEELLFTILRNQQVIHRVSQLYEEKLRVVFAQGAARDNIDVGIDTLLAITDDPIKFLNSLSDEEFKRYFGLTPTNKAELIALLHGYFYFQKTVYFSHGLSIRPFTSSDKTDPDTLKNYASQIKQFAVKLNNKDISVVEALNGDEDYFNNEEWGKQISERKRKFIEQFQEDFILQMFADTQAQEALRQLLIEEYDVIIPEGEVNVFSYIPEGVSASSLLAEAAQRDIQVKDGNALKSINDKAAKLLGKAVLTGAKVLFPEAAPVIEALQKANDVLKQLTGIDLEEKLGKLIEIILAAGAVIGGIVLYLITHNIPALMGFLGGLALSPFFGPLAPIAGTFIGAGVGSKISFGSGVDTAKSLVTGPKSAGANTSSTGGLKGALKGLANLSSSGFLASASLALGMGITTLGGVVIQNAQRTPLARPLPKVRGAGAGVSSSNKICWPGDGVVEVHKFYGTGPDVPPELAGKKHEVYNRPGLGGQGDAIDIATAGNVYAPFSGTIEYYSQYSSNQPLTSAGGNYAILRGDNGINAGFLHLTSEQLVPNGSHVNVQDIIAHADTSGNAFGPHLHYEVWGHQIDPSDVAPEPFEELGKPISHTTCKGGGGGTPGQVIEGEKIACIDFKQVPAGREKDMLWAAVLYLNTTYPAYLNKICSSGSVVFQREASNGASNANSHPGSIVFYDTLFTGNQDNVLYTVTHELGHQIMYLNTPVYTQFQTSVCSQNNPLPFYAENHPGFTDVEVPPYGMRSCVEDFGETAAVYVDASKNHTQKYVQALSTHTPQKNFAENVLFK